jgi:hypothetical protein
MERTPQHSQQCENELMSHMTLNDRPDLILQISLLKN